MQGTVHSHCAALQHGHTDWSLHTSQAASVFATTLQGTRFQCCMEMLLDHPFAVGPYRLILRCAWFSDTEQHRLAVIAEHACFSA